MQTIDVPVIAVSEAMATITVASQGHAPLLKDPTTTEAIRHFLTAADADRQFATLASA